MSVFVKATEPPAPRIETASSVGIIYAVVLVAMAVAQLFTFDTFIELLNDFNLPLGGARGYTIAAVLVVSEVFALPFLLRMAVSPAFRYLSMGLGWIAALLWVFLSVWAVVTYPVIDTIGFLGTVGALTPGWWAVFVSVAFAILAAWASWGMWPATQRKK